MVVGMITISTCYGDADIPVEILGKGSNPGTARVRALNGMEPFTKMSHGGPYQDSKAVVFTQNLRNVRLEADPVEPDGEIPEVFLPPEDWFLETAYEDRTFVE
jgi:hypothetical protein